ncbi:EAL domain-containing protein [Rhodopila sp.]|uniref:EAL domain-containing protein n=1 Tax=Rhodopila sp. TaxID=2480087 RepID=UPI003D13BC4C
MTGEACRGVVPQGGGLAGSDRFSPPDLNLLLVSRSASWDHAVRSATREIGGGNVATCGARDALARLARQSPHYSHVLVDGDAADGLLKALADLASEIAGPETDMLMLGTMMNEQPHVRVIPAAETRAVREALMTTPPRIRSDLGLSELRAALDGTMIEPRYQPIIRMSDRHPIGLEALVRLSHPVAGVLLPSQFVPQIEDAGLAGQLTELVSGRVLADLLGPDLAGSGLRISVNFPLDVLLRPAALDRLEAQRVAAGIPASRIIVELTESKPVANVVTLRRSLEHLRGLGYGIAIDDVGPAVPRLAPLLELPFTSLKLDKDLVMRAIVSPETERFVATTIAQAKQHGLTVVAEGVETEETWARMLALGADEAQGFLAARPLPLAAVPIWLEAWNAGSRAA